jgi:hypothetical protein
VNWVPVVFHEADVVLARVEADRGQRLQVDLLRVAGIRLEDDLVLVVLLKAVGVLGVAAVVRADGGLDIRHVPGLGAEHAQEGGGVHGARAHLAIVRLPDDGAAAGPELLQSQDHGLEGGLRLHKC